MNKKKIIVVSIIIIVIVIVGLLVLFKSKGSNLDINMSKWNYDETNNIYYQIGVEYASKIEAKDYETLGIYVPGEYLDCSKNSDGTYKCEINEKSPTTAFFFC